jgi:signal transduction histidine kinase
VVEQHLAADLPAVMADFSALCQCLQNLVVNALKYGGKTPSIAIRANSVRADNGKADEVWISVEDHGIGIDNSELKQIFEPFYRSPVVTAAQIHGTGLGLPLAKSIAEAMGGKISVVSKMGIGSRFTLHLPVAHPIQLENQTQLEQRVSQ